MIRDVVLVWMMVIVTTGIVVLLVVSSPDGEEGPKVVQPPPGTGASPTVPASETPGAGQLTFEINMIPTIQFDKTELTIPTNREAKISADNTDDGILHNFAIYNSRDEAEGGADAIAATEFCNAPCTESVTASLPQGEYFFRCDVHPQQMTGTLAVE